MSTRKFGSSFSKEDTAAPKTVAIAADPGIGEIFLIEDDKTVHTPVDIAEEPGIAMTMQDLQEPIKDHLDPMDKKKKVGNYLLGRTLGEGSFTKIREGLHIISRENVAVKIVSKKAVLVRDYVKRNVRREAVMLQRLDHVHVLRLYEIMETENSYYLVVELAENGDFIKYLSHKKSLTEVETRKYIRQMASALDHMHASNIVHRDLKLENLLLDKDNNLKIVDFGLSNVFYGDSSLSTQCGSPVYAAPEMFHSRTYGAAVDIWSMGVCMYAMLTGRLPFIPSGSNLTLLHMLILKGPDIPDSLTDGCVTLLSHMLTIEVPHRIQMEDIVENPWLLEGCGEIVRQPSIGNLFPHIPKVAVVNYMTAVFNFLEDDIFSSVMERKVNAIGATYHLLQKRYESGRQLIGFTLKSASTVTGSSAYSRRNGETQPPFSGRIGLPLLNREHTNMTDGGSGLNSGSVYKNYLKLLKNSKNKDTSHTKPANNREISIRRRKAKARGEILRHSKSKEESGFLPDFILTYTHNESSLPAPKKFEWEQSFIVTNSDLTKSRKSTANSQRHSVNFSKDRKLQKERTAVSYDSDNESSSLLTPPNTAVGKARHDPNTYIHPTANNNSDLKLDFTNLDDKTEKSEATSSVNGCSCKDEPFTTFQKQKSRLERSVTQLRKSKNLHAGGGPIPTPKNITPREARLYEEMDNAQIIGQGRKLVERSKTIAKMEDVHSIWTRKARTAGGNRCLPDLPPATYHRQHTDITFRTIEANGVWQFPELIHQMPERELAMAPGKETHVDGVTDVIRVHITSAKQ